MPRFLSPLRVELMYRGKVKPWVLLTPLIYESDVLGRIVAAPAGFVTDFASVPRIPLAYWLTGDTSHEAAVIHDYLYVNHQCTRSQADAVLREASEVTGVPAWRRTAMYAAVRLAGGQYWNSPTVATP